MPAQLAVEILLPELGKPDVPAVVVQGPAGEVAVETCPGRKWMEGINPDASHIPKLPRQRGREVCERWGHVGVWWDCVQSAIWAELRVENPLREDPLQSRDFLGL